MDDKNNSATERHKTSYTKSWDEASPLLKAFLSAISFCSNGAIQLDKRTINQRLEAIIETAHNGLPKLKEELKTQPWRRYSNESDDLSNIDNDLLTAYQISLNLHGMSSYLSVKDIIEFIDQQSEYLTNITTFNDEENRIFDMLIKHDRFSGEFANTYTFNQQEEDNKLQKMKQSLNDKDQRMLDMLQKQHESQTPELN